MVLVLAAQGALAIVHVKVVMPKGKFPTVVVPKFALPKVTPTAELVHVPTPTLGILPVKVEVALQIFWFAPAIAVVGAGKTVIVTLDSEGVQGALEIVHLKT